MDGIRKYSVGHIAELCSISTKQLRYLDEKNVIVPAIRDENNNYRYYTEKQIEEILLIKEMKQLGIPLKRIAHILKNRNVETLRQELHSRLANAREEVERAMAKYDKILDMVMRFISAGDFHNTTEMAVEAPIADKKFHVVEVKPRAVVSTRYPGLYSVDRPFIARRAELYGIIEKYDLETSGPNMAIFHNGYMNQFNAELEDCLTDLEVLNLVKKINPHCPYCYTQKGFFAVTGVFVGHYRYMQPLYRAMEEWAIEQELQLSGDSVEEYVIGVTHTHIDTTYVTRIFLPLAGFGFDQ